MQGLRFFWIGYILAAASATAVAETTPTYLQTHYLKASNTAANAELGVAVAISGDTLVVGAHRERSGARDVDGNQADTSAPDSGAAYVFVRSGTSWVQQAYLKPFNTDAGDRFGSSVAISGNTIVVGAPREDSAATGVDETGSDNASTDSGAAYVFVRVGSQWRQQAYLKASNTGDRDNFGASVAIAGDVVVVGAPEEDSNATGTNGDGNNDTSINSGAAYVFQRSGSFWFQRNYLKASNTGGNDRFGWSVAADRATLAIGAPGESSSAIGVNGDQQNNFQNQAGAVYIFDSNGFNWIQSAYMKAFNTEANDQFGWSVDLSAETVVIGAIGEDSNAVGINGNQLNNLQPDSGAAYVYFRRALFWQAQAYVKAINADEEDLFGYSVTLAYDRLVIGAPGEDGAGRGVNSDPFNDAAPDSGAGYYYTRRFASWRTRDYLKSFNSDFGDQFASAAAVSDEGTLVVGSAGEDGAAVGVNGDGANNSALNSGAAHVFVDPTGGPISINPGLSDAWVNYTTAGQGVIVNVFPELGRMFVAMFTYDLVRPDEDTPSVFGEPGHRWLTAFGPYSGDLGILEVELTEGGVFDWTTPVPSQTPAYGTWTLKFHDCNHLTLGYDFPSIEVQGVMDLTRAADDNVDLCLELGKP